MSTRLVLPLLALAGLVWALHAVAAQPEQHAAPATTPGTFRFDAGVAPADRAAFLAAVAAARPAARRLIGKVDGLVDVHVGPTGVPGAIGLTESEGARYRVTVDLSLVAQRYGDRGIERTVLHELGHVIDRALVSDALIARLDAEIPTGLGCEDGKLGACAGRRERFAETFAKWALGDIGVNLDVGYKIPPPSVPLDAWGEPLARLADH